MTETSRIVASWPDSEARVDGTGGSGYRIRLLDTEDNDVEEG